MDKGNKKNSSTENNKWPVWKISLIIVGSLVIILIIILSVIYYKKHTNDPMRNLNDRIDTLSKFYEAGLSN